MAIILRIDVDNPYGCEYLPRTTLNYLRLNYPKFFPAFKSLNYLWHTKNILDHLCTSKTKAHFCFMPSSVPQPNFVKQMKDHNQKPALHAVDTINFQKFQEELEEINSKTQEAGPIKFFTKHGDGKIKLARMHHTPYETEVLLKYAQKADLKCFSGNGTDPKEQEQEIEGIRFFPSAFWIDHSLRKHKEDVEWLVKESKKRDLVVLIHPFWFVHEESTRKDLEYVIKNSDFEVIE